MLFFALFFHALVCFRELLNRENGNGVNNQTENSIDDCNGSPTECATAKPSYSVNGDCFDEDFSGECKDETEGTELNSFAGVFSNERRKGCIRNIVCGKEYCVKECVSSSFRVGYMVLPKHLAAVYEKELGFYSCTVPTYIQLVLAELINSGSFERHINRVRRTKRKQETK